MRPDEIEEMRCLRLFEQAAPENVERMLRSSFLQRFPAFVELAREGEPADFLHIIVDGQVEVFSRYRERETTVAVLKSGDSFILAAVLLDRLYLKSARTLTAARVLLVPAEAVRSSFGVDAAFSRNLALEMAKAYRHVVKELKNQKLRSSLERLANWLLAYDREQGGTGRFELPFDKKVLAARLGMAPEVLSRAIATLTSCDVKVSGPFVKINNREALTRLAQPQATIDDGGI